MDRSSRTGTNATRGSLFFAGLLVAVTMVLLALSLPGSPEARHEGQPRLASSVPVPGDGTVQAFGSAPSYGDLAGHSLNKAVVGMAATPDGRGYWMVAADGGVFAFGDAGYFGSAAGSIPTGLGAVALSPSAGGSGYWIADGSGQGALAGRVITIDPGHNGGNGSDPAYINRPVFNGRSQEACDTTGTATDSGYTESQFNFNVALDLKADLQSEGATVVLTRTTNSGVGPCVTDRAAIGNQAHSDAAVSIHADGGPAAGRGFAILEPVADGPNNAIVQPSRLLGADLRDAFAAGTKEPTSTYDGVNGIQPRNDLAGTNLSTVPKVFIECANMRNAADAALVVSPAWQAEAAAAIAAGITTFLSG